MTISVIVSRLVTVSCFVTVSVAVSVSVYTTVGKPLTTLVVAVDIAASPAGDKGEVDGALLPSSSIGMMMLVVGTGRDVYRGGLL